MPLACSICQRWTRSGKLQRLSHEVLMQPLLASVFTQHADYVDAALNCVGVQYAGARWSSQSSRTVHGACCNMLCTASQGWHLPDCPRCRGHPAAAQVHGGGEHRSFRWASHMPSLTACVLTAGADTSHMQLHMLHTPLQITTETRADGNYSSEMTVVTVEPGGLAGQDEQKIRMLLVRHVRGVGCMLCWRDHSARSCCAACMLICEHRVAFV
jgi:hypothetical protein